MALRIQTNLESMVAQHRFAENREKLEHTQNKMASGTRVVKASDDAAGLAISESLRSALRSTGQNLKNTQSAFFLLQTADSAINEIANICIRMKELAVQAASDTNGDKERGYLNNEYQELKRELNRISEATIFNGRPLLNGQGETIAVQVGPSNNGPVDRIKLSTGFRINTESLGVNELDVLTTDSAREALDPIGHALEVIANVRGVIGAGESRLATTERSLMQFEESEAGAFSQIRDADMAFETAEYAKYNILNQASVAVLSQANATPQLVLKLLG